MLRFGLLLTATGVNWIFGTQHFVGIDGHPRRILSSTESNYIVSELANLGLLILPCSPSNIIPAISYPVHTVSWYAYCVRNSFISIMSR